MKTRHLKGAPLYAHSAGAFQMELQPRAWGFGRSDLRLFPFGGLGSVGFMAGLDPKGLFQPRYFCDFKCLSFIQLPTPFSLSESTPALSTAVLCSADGNPQLWGCVQESPSLMCTKGCSCLCYPSSLWLAHLHIIINSGHFPSLSFSFYFVIWSDQHLSFKLL